MYNRCVKTTFIGKKVEYLSTCHSTNDIATGKIREGNYVPGEIVICDEQVSGKGQRGNGWVSQGGLNLTFSLILQPDFLTVDRQFLLSQAVALGVWRYLDARIPGVRIKWPNDVLAGGKKMVGILIENTVRGQYLQTAVVGIGVNINQVEFGSARITSLALETGKTFSLSAELEELLVALEYYLVLLERGETATLRDAYLEVLFGYGERRAFLHEGERLEGRVTGISAEGRILLETGEPFPRDFGLQELVWLWE